MVNAYPIHTERLTIRLMRSSDTVALLAYRNDPEVAALQDWELPYTADMTGWLAEQDDLADLADQGWTQLAIDFGGIPIGDLAICLDETGQQANLGFTLAREHWRQGLAREAALAVVGDLIERRGVVRVTGDCDPRNVASMRVLEAVGLVHSHNASASYRWRGQWTDTTYYAVTADQWRAWRDRPMSPPREVALVPIDSTTARSWRTVVTHYSQRRFVSPVDDSYADALYPDDWLGGRLVPVLRGIVADGERVGFVMYAAVTPHLSTPYLWRFLVDRRHQGRGIGRRAMQALAHELRAAGSAELWTTFGEGPGSPRGFYLGLGARHTGEIIDGETKVTLPLSALGA